MICFLRRRLGSVPVAILASFSAIAMGLCVRLPSSEALPADASRGEALAKRWCASCHIVANDQTRGMDNVPTFATIAKMPGFSAEKIAQFLMDPHPKMPDMQLDRGEARDLGAYIQSTGR
jgi:mono/diheme cytochrome c family protein